jgi:HEAT repeat protein
MRERLERRRFPVKGHLHPEKGSILHGAHSLDDLAADLASHDDIIRVRARTALVSAGKAAVPVLTEALKSRDDLKRLEAIKALNEIGDPYAAPALVDALQDDDFSVRWVAAVGLVGLNLGAVKPLLQALITHGDSYLMREGAHHVVHGLAKGELRKYLLPLLATLEHSALTVEVPIAAERALELLEKDYRISLRTRA